MEGLLPSSLCVCLEDGCVFLFEVLVFERVCMLLPSHSKVLRACPLFLVSTMRSHAQRVKVLAKKEVLERDPDGTGEGSRRRSFGRPHTIDICRSRPSCKLLLALKSFRGCSPQRAEELLKFESYGLRRFGRPAAVAPVQKQR